MIQPKGDAGTALFLLPAQSRLTPPGKVFEFRTAAHCLLEASQSVLVRIAIQSSFQAVRRLVQLILYFLILLERLA